MTRIIPVSALALLTACWFGSVGCSSSNDPSNGGTNTGSSGSGTTTAGSGAIVPSGGTSSGGDGTVAGSTSIA
ncbi:MAG TPA: hypothetical protein VHV51_13875, partial [Polyangiaceae bacterium]|nr:hypothetical protein [Polyangiaceae bacterium]